MTRQKPPKRQMGRPPTGLDGKAKISVDYHSVRLRVPPDVRGKIIAAADVLNRPQWRVLVEAFEAYIGEGPGLSAEQQKAIRKGRR